MNKKNNVYFESLSLGETGTMVYVAQKLLNTIGYELTEDGVFSDKMEMLVKEFQSSTNNLVVNGVVDYETMKAMDEASSQIK